MFTLKKISDLTSAEYFHYRFVNESTLEQGVGSDTNEKTAQNKAISEYLELVIAKELSLKSTAGIAVHTNKKLAISNSINEVLERHYFLESWFSGKFPSWIECYKLNEDYYLTIGKIASGPSIEICIGVFRSFSNKIGFRVLLVAEKNIDDSKRKLLTESYRLIALLKKTDFLIENELFQFNSSVDHFAYYLIPSKENITFIDQYLFHSNHSYTIKNNHEIQTTHGYKSFYGKRYWAYTTSSKLIKYFIGLPGNQIHIRFKSIAPDRLIHPLG